MKNILTLAVVAFGAFHAQAGTWQPPGGQSQIPIWPSRPPGETVALGKPETIETDKAHPERLYDYISNVSVPTMTVYPPKSAGNGAAIIVFPGGGFQLLAIDLEGTEICDWANGIGMTCIVLKYRVPNSAHHYDEKCKCAVTPKTPAALQDAQRAIRLVRFNAAKLHIDPHKIGVIGFSAGGYLVAQTSTLFNRKTYQPVDDIDQVSARPDFALPFYPGHLWRDGNGSKARFDPDTKVTGEASPTFIVQASDDPVDSVENSLAYYRELKRARVKVELHLFAQGGHAFGIRPTNDPVTRWPALAEGWLKSIGILN